MEQKTVKSIYRQNDRPDSDWSEMAGVINERSLCRTAFWRYRPLIMESYDWFTREAAKKVAKPEDVKAPIWCSISPDNCLKPIPDTVVYVLEVPQDQIIYFDDVKWDYVLNRIYLPKDDEDAAAYKRHLKEIGVENGFEFFEGRYKGMFPEEVERIRASWKRVFEIDNWTIFNVCGNIWEIKKEWVKRIVRPGESVD